MTETFALSSIAADIALRFVGAFYVFAGILATRVGLTSHLMDRALAAISGGRPNAAETGRTIWLIASSAVIFIGGAMLMLMLDGAQWVFLAAALGQLVYLSLLSPLLLDPGDPPEPSGRSATRNAAVLYGAMTLLVLWAWATGRMRPWEVWSATLLGLAAVAYFGWLAWTARSISSIKSPSASQGSHEGDPPDDPEALRELDALGRAWADDDVPMPNPPRRMKLKPSISHHPMQSMDPNWTGDVLPSDLGLDHDVALRLEAWNESYQGLIDRDGAPVPGALVALAGRDEEGRSLARAIADALPDLELYYQGAAGTEERIHATRHV